MIRYLFLPIFLFVAGLIPSAVGADKPEPKKAVVEFRWLSGIPIKDVTDEKGFQTTCYPNLSYAYLKPVLSNADVQSATLHEHDWTRSGSGIQYSIVFQLTGDAKKKLVKEAGERDGMQLAVFVDGHYYGTAYFTKADSAKFNPFAGLIRSKTEAERIANSFK